MNLLLRSRSQSTRGYVLLMVTILLAISIIMVTGLLNYSSGNAKQNARNNDYYSALGAAEASTEKVLSQVTSDFRDYGVGYVQLRLDTYRRMIPLATEASTWTNFDFMDLSGQLDRNEVQYNASTGSYVPLGTQYGPLKAFKDQVRILSNARARNSPNPVSASVYQDIELSRIPIFQYAVFYNITLEFTPLPPMVISGPVHCNTNIYVNPAGVLTFNNDLTASGTIIQGPNPASPMLPALGGSV